eukprot:382322_1
MSGSSNQMFDTAAVLEALVKIDDQQLNMLTSKLTTEQARIIKELRQQYIEQQQTRFTPIELTTNSSHDTQSQSVPTSMPSPNVSTMSSPNEDSVSIITNNSTITNNSFVTFSSRTTNAFSDPPSSKRSRHEYEQDNSIILSDNNEDDDMQLDFVNMDLYNNNNNILSINENDIIENQQDENGGGNGTQTDENGDIIGIQTDENGNIIENEQDENGDIQILNNDVIGAQSDENEQDENGDIQILNNDAIGAQHDENEEELKMDDTIYTWNQDKLKDKLGTLFLTSKMVGVAPANCLGQIVQDNALSHTIKPQLAAPYENVDLEPFLRREKYTKFLSFNRNNAENEACFVVAQLGLHKIGITWKPNSSQINKIQKEKRKLQISAPVSQPASNDLFIWQIPEIEDFQISPELKEILYQILVEVNVLDEPPFSHISHATTAISKTIDDYPALQNLPSKTLIRNFYNDHNRIIKSVKSGQIQTMNIEPFEEMLVGYVVSTQRDKQITSSNSDMTTEEIMDKRERVRMVQFKRAAQMEAEAKEKQKQEKLKRESMIEWLKSSGKRNEALLKKTEAEIREKLQNARGVLAAKIIEISATHNIEDILISKDSVTGVETRMTVDDIVDIVYVLEPTNRIYPKCMSLLAGLTASPTRIIMEKGVKICFKDYQMQLLFSFL